MGRVRKASHNSLPLNCRLASRNPRAVPMTAIRTVATPTTRNESLNADQIIAYFAGWKPCFLRI